VAINVGTNNAEFSSVDGVLFSKNKTALCIYPIGNTRTSYSIPNSVKSIWPDAFRSCRSLTSIIIPSSVTHIWDGAFYGCSKLTSIVIPNSVTNIENEAFYGCSSLTSITIPNSVTNIGDEAFYDCNNLTIKGYSGSTAEKYAKDNKIRVLTRTE